MRALSLLGAVLAGACFYDWDDHVPGGTSSSSTGSSGATSTGSSGGDAPGSSSSSSSSSGAGGAPSACNEQQFACVDGCCKTGEELCLLEPADGSQPGCRAVADASCPIRNRCEPDCTGIDPALCPASLCCLDDATGAVTVYCNPARDTCP